MFPKSDLKNRTQVKSINYTCPEPVILSEQTGKHLDKNGQ